MSQFFFLLNKKLQNQVNGLEFGFVFFIFYFFKKINK